MLIIKVTTHFNFKKIKQNSYLINKYSMKPETQYIYIDISLIPFNAATSDICCGLPRL